MRTLTNQERLRRAARRRRRQQYLVIAWCSFIVLLVLGILGGIAFVAEHFIAKWW